MPEIHVVQRDNRHLYQNYFDPYFRLRHDIYVKQRKWMALGLPQMIDGMSVLAVLVDCDEATWKSLCRQIGLTSPTLTWHGLTRVNRQILPDISLLHSPTVQPAR